MADIRNIPVTVQGGDITGLIAFSVGETVNLNLTCLVPIVGGPLDLTNSAVVCTISCYSIAGVFKPISRQATLTLPATNGLCVVPLASGDTVPTLADPIRPGFHRIDIWAEDTSGNRIDLAWGTCQILRAERLPNALTTPLPLQIPLALGINWRGPWSSSTAYAQRDGVSYPDPNGGGALSSFICIVPNTNVPPVNGAGVLNVDWNYLAATSGAAGSQSGNLVFASPAGAPGLPGFRSLVIGDLPVGVTSSTVAVGNDLRFSPTPSAAGRIVYDTGSAYASLATVASGVLHANGAAAPSWAAVTGADFAAQSPALVFAGPVSGGATAPSFRSLAIGDLPTGQTSTTVPLGNDSRFNAAPSGVGKFAVDTGSAWTSRTLVAGDIPSLAGTYLPLAGGTMAGNVAFGSNTFSSNAAFGTATWGTIQQFSDSYQLFTWQPAEIFNSAAVPPFVMWGHSVSNSPGTTQLDQTFAIGWNRDRGGGRIVAGQSAMSLVFESDYLQIPTQLSTRQMETYFEFTSEDGSVSYRPLAFYTNRATNATNFLFIADVYQVNDRFSNAVFSVGAGGVAGSGSTPGTAATGTNLTPGPGGAGTATAASGAGAGITGTASIAGADGGGGGAAGGSISFSSARGSNGTATTAAGTTGGWSLAGANAANNNGGGGAVGGGGTLSTGSGSSASGSSVAQPGGNLSDSTGGGGNGSSGAAAAAGGVRSATTGAGGASLGGGFPGGQGGAHNRTGGNGGAGFNSAGSKGGGGASLNDNCGNGGAGTAGSLGGDGGAYNGKAGKAGSNGGFGGGNPGAWNIFAGDGADANGSNNTGSAGGNLFHGGGNGGLGGNGGVNQGQGGPGGAATSVFPGGTGGEDRHLGGAGGVGSALQISGKGGDQRLVSGAAGASGGAGGNVGGNVYVDANAGTSGNANGFISIGTGTYGAIASAINIGANSATSHIGFFGATAVVKQNGTGNTHTVAAGSTTSVFTNTTFDGSTGSTAYTVGDIVAALKNYGLLAA